MPSDRSIVALGQNPSWGHWEQHVFYVHPGTKLDVPIAINLTEPFELHVGAGSCLSLCDRGHEWVCYIEQEARLCHLGIAEKAHFILEEHAALIHKNVLQEPRLDTSEIQIDLMQPEACVDWGDGICLRKTENYRQSLKIEHFAPRTHSECCLKSILYDQGHLNFTCDVFIHENAAQSTAHQKNLNHILSSQGQVTALPRLHIFNKAIEASHGTATQPIPEETLFYLQSRGLSLQQAEQLYLESFFQDFYANPLRTDGE
jgi:ABC-type transport system involved in Fe-S cluster assembly, permease component